VAIRRFLLQRGISCLAINLTRFRRPDGDGVYYPKNAVELLRVLLRLRCDVLHLHIGGNLTLRLLALGLVCCRLPGRRAVLTFHSGGFPSSPEGRATTATSFSAFVLRQFDALIAVNGEIARFFEKCGVERSRIRLIPPHSLTPQKEQAELPGELREFFESHRPLLLTVGLLEPEYDLPLQIQALGLARQRFPDAGLVIIGSGSLEQRLRAQIAAARDGSHIRLCGDMEHGVTLRAIEDCDVFLRTTLYDGDSISVREALQLGAPVIATDNGMRPGGCDLIPPSNLAALLEAIERQAGADRRERPGAAVGTENLEQVLAVYEELAKR
jgi:glycosyltransferase involved in cell wall biosynthesis